MLLQENLKVEVHQSTLSDHKTFSGKTRRQMLRSREYEQWYEDQQESREIDYGNTSNHLWWTRKVSLSQITTECF